MSRDVIFEEGKPSWTLASVGEQIPIFDAGLTPLTNTDHHLPDNPVDHTNADQGNQQILPVVPNEPRRSIRMLKKPSQAGMQSAEYKQ